VRPGQHASPATPAKMRAASPAQLSIYDGRVLVGAIRRVGKKFEARDAARKLIGRYRTVKQAAAAINQSCESRSRG
jgi:hypothetical protein